MSYYPESDSHIRQKLKIVWDLSNYTSKKELDHATILAIMFWDSLMFHQTFLSPQVKRTVIVINE